MVSTASFDGFDARGVAWTILGVPFRLQTYRNLCYLALAFPLGLFYFVLLVTGFSVGIGLVVVLVGIPFLIAMLALAVAIATVERRIAVVLLGIDVPTRSRPMPDSPVEWVRRLVTDRGTWTALVYLGTKLFIGVAALVITMSLLVTAVSMLAVPLVYNQPGVYVGVVTDPPIGLHPALYIGWNNLLVGLETVITLQSWQIDTLAEALIVAGSGIVLGIVSLHLLNALARFSGWYTRLLLGTSDTDTDVGD